MAYVDNLLASGEQLLRREHQHWFVLIANAAYAIVAWIVAVLVLLATATILRGNDSLSAAGGWVVLGPRASMPGWSGSERNWP